MATALASQLQALAAPTHSFSKTRTRPSILFDAQQAADIDIAATFSLALAGLEELASLDSRFLAFQRSLFSAESCQLDRELQEGEINANLDAALRSYMCLLSDYLLLSAAQQTLEYLIRRYKIHVYNVDDLVKHTLPYHETSLFVRIIQLLQIKKTRWHFFEGVKKSGAAPPRRLLVQQCIKDRVILEAICELGHALALGGKVSRSKVAYSFSVAIIVEVLAVIIETNLSPIISSLIPYITQSIDKSSTEESEIGALMVIGALAFKTTLSEGTISLFFDLIARLANNEGQGGKVLEMAILIMVHLTQTQTLLIFPQKAFKHIVKLRKLTEILQRISKTYNTEIFLSLFIKSLVNHCLVSHHYSDLLEAIIRQVPFENYIEETVKSLLILSSELEVIGVENQLENIQACVLKKIFLVLYDEFPQKVDKGINQFIESFSESNSDKREGVRLFLNDLEERSLLSVLTASNQTVYMSLEHKEAHVRSLAVKHVGIVAINNPKLRTLCQEALLIRLEDEELSVVETVFNVEGLVELMNPDQLFSSIKSILLRCARFPAKGHKKFKDKANSVLELCLEFLASVFLSTFPTYTARVGQMFLGFMLPSIKTLELNLSALRLAKSIEWNLFSCLPNLGEWMLEQPGSKKEERMQKLSCDIIVSLSEAMLKDGGSLLELIAHASDFEIAKPIILLALLHALKLSREGLHLKIVEGYTSLLRQEWATVESTRKVQYVQNADGEVLTGVIPIRIFKLMEQDRQHGYCNLLHWCLYEVITAIPLADGEEESAVIKILEDLFLLFSSAIPISTFHAHVTLLLGKIPILHTIFLSKFFNVEDGSIPLRVQVNSLHILSNEFRKDTDFTVMQLSLPYLVVGLGSPMMAVRRAVVECLKTYYSMWEEDAKVEFVLKDSKEQRQLLASRGVENFLEVLLECQTSFVSSEDFLHEFLSSALGQPSSDNESNESFFLVSSIHRLKEEDKRCILLFLIQAVLEAPIHVQYRLLIAMEGVGFMQEQAVETTRALESLLGQWKLWKSQSCSETKLSETEFKLFKHLLKVHLHYEGIIDVPNEDITGRDIWFKTFMEVTDIPEYTADGRIMEIPCVALSCLESKILTGFDQPYQDAIFERIIHLSRMNAEGLQRASHDCLLAIDVAGVTIERFISGVGNKLSAYEQNIVENHLAVVDASNGLSAVLESLIAQRSYAEMGMLVESLFSTLSTLFRISKYCSSKIVDGVVLENLCARMIYVEQLLLEVIERITKATWLNDINSDSYDIEFLVEFAHETTHAESRNQALSLIGTLGQRLPDKVLQHVINILSIIGETTLIQDDNHSYLVTEKLLSAVVPGWLEQFKNPRLLLKIFVDALPRMPLHRRTPLLKAAIRLMQESNSLHVLLLLLLDTSYPCQVPQGRPSRKRVRDDPKNGSDDSMEVWWKEFSSTLYEQYDGSVWLSALLKLLKACHSENLLVDLERWFELLLKVTEFIQNQLERSNLSSRVDSIVDDVKNRVHCLGLLEEVLCLMQRTINYSKTNRKRQNKKLHVVQENLNQLLEGITRLLSPTFFAEGMAELLKHGDVLVKVRVLKLIAKKMVGITKQLEHGTESESCVNAFEKLVGQVGTLIGSCSHEKVSVDLTLAAISAIDCCSVRFGAEMPTVFISNLPLLIGSSQQNSVYTPAAFHCIASIISETGPSALPALNDVMKFVSDCVSKYIHLDGSEGIFQTREPVKGADLPWALLALLDVVIQRLGNFLSPYLKDVLNLLMLEPCFFSDVNQSVVKMTEDVRNHLPKGVPVRLLIDPLIDVYEQTLERGEASTLACIEVLSSLVSCMDPGSVLLHYKKIFDLCLKIMDLRRRPPKLFISVTAVETGVISLLTQLVLKLSESKFKPLFFKVLEWAEVHDFGTEGSTHSVHRSIVFYRLVNKLADKLKSVFVPYFQYFLKGCILHLTHATEEELPPKPKKKQKVLFQNRLSEFRNVLSMEKWHLHQLIVSALHKCFLYDTVNFLDAEKFQMLMGPLVRQLEVERSTIGNDSNEWVPSTKDMDEALIACLGQMAITAGTDLLWKPLNREILMCTRTDAVHIKMVSMEIIKFFVDHLKEDYLVLLPETIPFLAELLEDEDLGVIAKSQEIIKLLEELSGESLGQYL